MPRFAISQALQLFGSIHDMTRSRHYKCYCTECAAARAATVEEIARQRRNAPPIFVKAHVTRQPIYAPWSTGNPAQLQRGFLDMTDRTERPMDHKPGLPTGGRIVAYYCAHDKTKTWRLILDSHGYAWCDIWENGEYKYSGAMRYYNDR